jgi:excisionase family DNA binding protein
MSAIQKFWDPSAHQTARAPAQERTCAPKPRRGAGPETDREVINRQTPFDVLPEFLSPEEFRRYLGLGRSTCYDLLRRNQIPHVRYGRIIRIPKAALPRAAVE